MNAGVATGSSIVTMVIASVCAALLNFRAREK